MDLIKNTTAGLFYVILLCTSLLVISCNGCKNETQRKIQLETPVTPIKIARFEQDLFGVDAHNLPAELAKLDKKYPAFYRSYAKDVLRMPLTGNDSLFVQPMSMLLSYKPMVNLFKAVDSAFHDLGPIEEELSLAMGIYHQEFRNKPIPQFISFLSEFGYATITYDSVICIGLDMYMNKRFGSYYRAYEFPEFMIRKLQPEYIVPNAIKALAIRDYEYQSSKDKRFIATMIVEGKVRYFAKALLPEVHDSILMGYTAQQLKWSQENEPQMWTHLIEKNLLYQSEPSEFMRYFNDGPFTSGDGVPAESSPMIATWAGLQIVRAYMDQNPSVTLRALMEETDFDKILKQSKYRPN